MSVFNLMKASDAIMGSRLRPSQKFVLLAILNHWSRRNPKPRPGIARLMDRTGYSRQTVIDAIADLVRLGVIPDPHQVDGAGQPKPGVALVFDLSEVVQQLDRLSVQKLDRSEKVDRSSSEGGPVYFRGPTGLGGPITEHQNGSRSSEETIEETSEETNSTSTSEVGSGFALTSPSSDPKPTKDPESKPPATKTNRGRGRSKPERSDADRSAHKRLTAVYFEVYEARVGEAPPFGEREGGEVWKLYDKIGLERSERCLRNAFGDEWGNRRSIQTVAADPGKFMGSAPKKLNGHPGQQANRSDAEAFIERRRQQENVS